MDVNVKYVNGMHFLGRGTNPVDIPIDASPEFGGSGQGASPMELLLIALAGCTGLDVISILSKMRLNFARFELNIEGDRAEDHPKYFTQVTVVYRLWGDNLDEGKIRHAVELSMEKYCSVSHTIDKAAKVDYRIELNPAE